MYELVVIYSDDTKETYPCKDYEDGERQAENLRFALGNQVMWTGVRRRSE